MKTPNTPIGILKLFLIFALFINQSHANQILNSKPSARCNTLLMDCVDEPSCRGFITMENQIEVWKSVVGYENAYEISSKGNVRSLTRIVGHPTSTSGRLVVGMPVKQYLHTTGYMVTHLYRKSKIKNCTIHRLVSLAFIPPVEGKLHINHKDGNKLNNHVTNLEWVTRQENAHHAYYVTGFARAGCAGRRGGNNVNSKSVIQKNKYTGQAINIFPSYQEAADSIGVHKTAISNACRGKALTCGGFIWEEVKSITK